MQALNYPLTGVQMIEASAGTGKTFTIASLYLRLILGYKHSLAASDPRKILVVTFTRAATQELRARIRLRLLQARDLLMVLNENLVIEDILYADPILAELCLAQTDRIQAIDHINSAVKLLDEAAIYTIHGFCQKVLGSFALEAGVPFKLEVARNLQGLQLEAVRDFWRHKFYGTDIMLGRAIKDLWASPEELLHSLKGPLNKPNAFVRGVTDIALPDFHKETLDLFNTLQKLWHESMSWIPEIADRYKLKKTSYRADHQKTRIRDITNWLKEATSPYTPPKALEYFTLAKVQQACLVKDEIQEPLFEVAQRCFQSSRILRELILSDAITNVAKRIQTQKASEGALSFDDLLKYTACALQGERGLALGTAIRENYPVALIDEFQDTDDLQWELFSNVYKNQSGVALLLIGDPKQAIYSFRGADVHTYIKAKKTVHANSRHHLLYNYRSTPQVICAVNALFSNNADPFLSGNDITFEPSEAPKIDEKSDKVQGPVIVEGEKLAAFNFVYVEAASDPSKDSTKGDNNTSGHSLSKSKSDLYMADSCAKEIARLLAFSSRGVVSLGDRKLESRDIAILTRTNYQAQLMQRALSKRGIASVYLGRSSIYQTEEAEDLLHIVEAIATPSDHYKVRSALATSVFGYELNELQYILTHPNEWEENLTFFYECHDVWADSGFLPMFWKLLKKFHIPERNLESKFNGTRSLTNLLHLGEHLQTESKALCDMDALCKHLGELIKQASSGSEEQELRLETDENLLKIVTVHRSKGLEYELVFLPFLGRGENKKEEYSTYFDTELEQVVIDLLPAKQQSSTIAERIEREALAEDLRLLYVALTRAKKSCFIFLANTKSLRNSGLGHLLTPQPSELGLSLDVINNSIDLLKQKTGELEDVFNLKTAHIEEERISIENIKNESIALAVKEFNGKIDTSWRVTSYSAISKGFQISETYAQNDYELAQEKNIQENITPPTYERSIHTLPKGTTTGNVLHAILERANKLAYEELSLEQIVLEELLNAGMDSDWTTVICSQVKLLMEYSLKNDMAGQPFSLANVSLQQKYPELEFDLGVQKISTQALNEALISLRGGAIGDMHKLNTQAIHYQGIVHGFIDLVIENASRFYILDYKTNYLGPNIGSYNRQNMVSSMLSHNYHLQYLFYTVAIHRLLKNRIKSYSYEKNFGGVYYLFVRGIDKLSEHGIYYVRPELEIIDRLDKSFL